MKREQQIEKASIGRYPECGEQQHALELTFQAGAMWADSHMNWISVDDELPKENGRYLFYHTITGVQSAYYYNDLMLDKAVTHWMPLPSIEHFADVSKKTSSSSEIPTNLKGGEK